mmetsp:Transcript_18485/g.24426  ORF Transcript_18485/g.24426 Transcript_18485/m.24426 type:complete len:372 (+) Transcript_18485:275-1390(+)|eukprot:CAMPEP_0117753642 /NCGR_PEP_ID=MMETSP0947-20121206/12358_1 /TAXON_ID=44440 /ORGANISM="Chattonella subsalsa, Strain CCMP2191" /LENGTH=371 /DNA_ID=CAMNT_0005572585 /DNA_START=256 /DNA_END=1371 /DNA_ORIENTATION=-
MFQAGSQQVNNHLNTTNPIVVTNGHYSDQQKAGQEAGCFQQIPFVQPTPTQLEQQVQAQAMPPLASPATQHVIHHTSQGNQAPSGYGYQYIPINNTISQANLQVPQIVLSDWRKQTVSGTGLSHLLPPKSAETQKKRLARNQREQKRAHKIAQVIEELKDILVASSFPLKSNSKYHVLTACEDMIRSLELRVQSYEMEKQLRMAVQRSYHSRINNVQEERSMEIEVDYYDSFKLSSIATGIASTDGKIISINEKFKTVTGQMNIADGLTIFSLTSADRLKESFLIISRLISERDERDYSIQSACRNSRGAFYSLIISLVLDNASAPYCFHVSLVDEGLSIVNHIGNNAPDFQFSTASVVSNDSSVGNNDSS